MGREATPQYRRVTQCRMPELPPQSAATLIVNAKNEVLLVHKAYGERVYGLPGGVVDPGELPTQAAVREAREEVGVEVRLEYQLGLYHLRGGRRPDQYASVYVATIVSGDPYVVDLQEISKIGWYGLDALPTLLNNDAVAATEDFLRGQRGVLRVVMRKNHPT